MTEPIEIGKLIEGEAQRDAIHVAVMPAVAGEALRSGQPVMLLYGTDDTAVGAPEGYNIKDYQVDRYCRSLFEDVCTINHPGTPCNSACGDY